ncbi:hypothetical protein PQC06_gp029 [Aeromonas phage LAh10]|uniref:Uncharacterized protein n=1 Tax=Aeromonas phage LAh10 TaxID=2591025 RepID=A0A514A1H4_9CAUD|nr:hypothetical protein PQC06_gp029 [Aeromonas phage LAh10]QDH47133.1 hypothetical protein LAh10_29 [Aeromonas phage LAh10]
MIYERYNAVRKRLIELHKAMTKYTYDVVAPPSAFMQMEELKDTVERERYKIGLDRLGDLVERPMTIMKMASAISINGDDSQIHFRWPRRDIPDIYENIQEYIKLWLEIKTDYAWLKAASLEELEYLEAVAKFVFGPYKEYRAGKINKEINRGGTGSDLLDALTGVWMLGEEGMQEISFVSHIALYREANGISKGVSTNLGHSETLESLLRGSSFGGGMGGLV